MTAEPQHAAPSRWWAGILIPVVVALVLLAVALGVGLIGPRPHAAPAVTCTLGASGADVQVQISNDSVPCSQEVAALATDGQDWYPLTALSPAGSAGSADGETLGRICRLTKGGSVFTVMDAGGAVYGTQLCSSEEQDGWTP